MEINNKEGHAHAPTADETSKEDDEQPLTGGTKEGHEYLTPTTQATPANRVNEDAQGNQGSVHKVRIIAKPRTHPLMNMKTSRHQHPQMKKDFMRACRCLNLWPDHQKNEPRGDLQNNLCFSSQKS